MNLWVHAAGPRLRSRHAAGCPQTWRRGSHDADWTTSWLDWQGTQELQHCLDSNLILQWPCVRLVDLWVGFAHRRKGSAQHWASGLTTAVPSSPAPWLHWEITSVDCRWSPWVVWLRPRGPVPPVPTGCCAWIGWAATLRFHVEFESKSHSLPASSPAARWSAWGSRCQHPSLAILFYASDGAFQFLHLRYPELNQVDVHYIFLWVYAPVLH